MNISEMLLQMTTDIKIGFTIAAIIGYCLYKIMVMKSTRKLDPPNDCNEISNNIQMYPDNYKLVLVIRTDLKMGKGKVAAQCAHAAVAAYKAAVKKCPVILISWEACGQAKITLKVDSEDALKEIAAQARNIGLLANIIEDAGHTQIKAGSKTVCAIGPGPAKLIDQVTGHLKLF